MDHIAAVVLAGGSGSRAGKQKQFHRVLGKPLLQYSVDALYASRVAKDIVIAVPAADIARTRRMHLEKRGARVHVIAGGSTRRWTTASALAYLAALPTPPTHVIVHDAARPLITPSLLRTVTRAMLEHGGAVTGIPSNGIPLEIRDGFVRDVYNKQKSGLHDGTTPQCFRFPELLVAYAKTKSMKGVDVSADNLEILKAAKSKLAIKMILAYPNHKVTYPEDFTLVTALLKESTQKNSKGR